MSPLKFISVVIAVVGLWLLSMSVFIVNEYEGAVKLWFGEFQRADYEPGLHFKTPFANSIRKFDRRILTLDANPEPYMTQEKKNVIVDSFVKWRITDIEQYYKSTRGSETTAMEILGKIVQEGLRNEFARRTVQEAISGERTEIMDLLKQALAKQAGEIGTEVIDVRIKRIELPPSVQQPVFQRMETERERAAKEIRARGMEAAARIEADADRQKTIILAEAYREAEQLRGEGEGKAAEIYAKAYNQNRQFYEFYRSISAYKTVFSSSSDVLVLDPNSEFFRYFGDDKGKK